MINGLGYEQNMIGKGLYESHFTIIILVFDEGGSYLLVPLSTISKNDKKKIYCITMYNFL